MAKLVHLSPGDELANGRYRVEREMNRGGTAIIYAAVDRAESESRVALKVVPLQPSAAMPSGALCREVQYAQILRHENIARCLGAFHAAHIGAFVIVTELVDGIDLLEFLNSRTDPLSEVEARHIFKQVLSAVTFLHNNGFVHRDLKPENVVIEQPLQHAKLVDFGLVKRFMSAKTVFCGTLDYNAPEMIEQPADAHPAFGRPYDPAKIDVWALGVLLYMSMTAKYPFASKVQPNNMSLTMQNIQSGTYARLPSKLSQEAKGAANVDSLPGCGSPALFIGACCMRAMQILSQHACGRVRASALVSTAFGAIGAPLVL